MKKLLALSALLSAFAFTQAQEVQTYSVYDTDQNGTINVGDAVGVANQAVQNVAADKTQQYVTAEDLRALLQVIDTKLEKLEAIETRLTSLEQMQSAIVLESGINVPGKAHRGHEYVDLGIKDAAGKTIYWATCNVGAESAEEYGDYFAWGETATKLDYSWSAYTLCNGTENSMNKYCTKSDYGVVDDKTVLDPEDDAARVNWGGSWRMPTTEELQLLVSQCYWLWVTSYNGKSVNGYVVYKAKDAADRGIYSYNKHTLSATYSVSSDAHIFLPTAGYQYDDGLGGAGSDGIYWSSSLSSESPNSAYCLMFGLGVVYYYGFEARDFGLPIRPVCQ